MKTTALLSVLLLAASANASWFGSDKPEYDSWKTNQLEEWLNANNIQHPSGYSHSQLKDLVGANWEAHKPWTTQMYEAAKDKFEGVQASTFESWDESRLRNFLLEQGIVEPKGPREQLVLEAKKRYNSFTAAASSLSAQASASASTAVYGDSKYQASKSAASAASTASKSAASAYAEAQKSASSLSARASATGGAYAAQASAHVQKALDDSKDYVYSTWDDNQLRTYLEKKGVIKTKQQATRDELLAKMRGAYLSTTEPVYQSWSDSYMRQWLIDNGYMKSDYDANREYYLEKMKDYYYTPQEKAWTYWSDSDLKAWLVAHGYIKTDAQIKRDKLVKLVETNWYNAKDNAWASWDDSSMKAWLVEHGYIRSDAQIKRDELIDWMNKKYTDTSSKTAEYLTWPNARLRGYLRAQGVDDRKIPINRPGLLQEVRIRWYEGQNRLEALIQKIREYFASGVSDAEDRFNQILTLISGKKEEYEAYGSDKAKQAKYKAADFAESQAASAEGAAKSARGKADKAKSEL